MTIDKIIALVAKAYKIDPSTLNRATNFQNDLKLDSMSLIQAIIEIEDIFNIEIPERKLFKLKTIGELSDYIELNVSAQ